MGEEADDTSGSAILSQRERTCLRRVPSSRETWKTSCEKEECAASSPLFSLVSGSGSGCDCRRAGWHKDIQGLPLTGTRIQRLRFLPDAIFRLSSREEKAKIKDSFFLQ